MDAAVPNNECGRYANYVYAAVAVVIFMHQCGRYANYVYSAVAVVIFMDQCGKLPSAVYIFFL